MGRLSASELCSLPMVLAAVAAEERRNGRRPLGRRCDREGAGDRDAEATQAALWGWRAQPRRGRGQRGTGRPYSGKDVQRGAAELYTARLPYLGKPKPGRRGNAGHPPRLQPAGGTAFTHSLARAPHARSFSDADWQRRQRAAVSSGLEGPPPPSPPGHRPGPEGGRGNSRRRLPGRSLKGPDHLNARTAPKGYPFPVVMLRVTFKCRPHTRHFIPIVKTLLIGFWGVCFVFVCGFFGIYFWVF